MTVTASDLALVHLGQQDRSPAGVLQPTDRVDLQLRIDVIEIEDDRIGFTALDAWVFGQKGIDDGAVRGPVPSSSLEQPEPAAAVPSSRRQSLEHVF